MDVISRAEAREKGLKRYCTGEACKAGHRAERLVSNFRCMACDRETKAVKWRSDEFRLKFNEKRKEFNEKNYDLLKNRRANFGDEKKARRKEQSRRWLVLNREKNRLRSRANYDKSVRSKYLSKSEAGRKIAAQSGTLMELDKALDIFKAQDNAFEFVDSLAPSIAQDIPTNDR